MTVLAILWSFSFNLYDEYNKDNIRDNEISDAQLYWSLLVNVINKNGDIPLNNCKNITGWHDEECFIEDPLWDWWEDWICWWITDDLSLDADCDNGCVVVDCTQIDCRGNEVYYDFEKTFWEILSYEYRLLTDSFLDKISYRICPQLNGTGSSVVWKWMETEFETFNPSFSINYEWFPVFEYNSNP